MPDPMDFCGELCSFAEELIKPKWTPVTERMPERNVLVLCMGARGGMFLGYPYYLCDGETTAYTKVPNANQGRYTKYWMPLPEPPEGG